VDECKPLLCGALRTLNLSGCVKLTVLPAEIGGCTNLHTLNLTDCLVLTLVPAELGQGITRVHFSQPEPCFVTQPLKLPSQRFAQKVLPFRSNLLAN